MDAEGEGGEMPVAVSVQQAGRRESSETMTALVHAVSQWPYQLSLLRNFASTLSMGNLLCYSMVR